jgi:high-affinity iron transporter
MPAVWIGVFLAVAVSLLVGAGLQLVSAEFPQKQQELFEAIVGLIAVGVLVSMVFWMRKAARSMKSTLHHSIDSAFSASTGASWALIGMVFFAVAREGLESVFFLLAIFQQSPGAAAPLSAFAGVVCAAAIGYLIFVGGVRLNLRRFFRWTGVFILIVAAGILSGAVRSLHEAGLWNGLQERAYDFSNVLPDDGPVGSLLSGIFNYQASPAVGELIVYVIFLVASLYLFLRPHREAARKDPVAKPQELRP